MEEKIYKWVVGDKYHDGHGQFREYYIKSNMTSKRITELYNKTAELTEVDILAECSEYDFPHIHKDDKKSIRDNGVYFVDLEDHQFDEDGDLDTFVGLDEYIELVFRYVHFFKEDSEIFEMKIEDAEELIIADHHFPGYGLFY